MVSCQLSAIASLPNQTPQTFSDDGEEWNGCSSDVKKAKVAVASPSKERKTSTIQAKPIEPEHRDFRRFPLPLTTAP
jgi:hypothetical protein